MPSGYRKRQARTVGHKAARGGSSHGKSCNGLRSYCYPRNRNDNKINPGDYHGLWAEAITGYGFIGLEPFTWMEEEEGEAYDHGLVDQAGDEGTEISSSLTTSRIPDHQSTTSHTDESYCCVSTEQDDHKSVLTGFSMLENECDDLSQWTAVEENDFGTSEEELSFVCIPDVDTANPNNKMVLNDPHLHEEAVTTCAICLESDKEVQPLMKNCKHPHACYDCLRTHYVVNAEKGITPYPLKCYWPGCDRLLRLVQVERLVQNQKELSAHIQRENKRKRLQRQHTKAISKAKRQQKEEDLEVAQLQRRRAKRLVTRVSCSFCQHPSIIPLKQLEQGARYSWCDQCGKRHLVDDARLAQEDLQQLLQTVGDKLINCPQCLVCLVKDGGCDHMTCVCGAQFRHSHVRQVLETPGLKIEDPRNPYKGKVDIW